MRIVWEQELQDSQGKYLGYSVVIHADGEILLVNNAPPTDMWGNEMDGCCRVERKNPYEGVKVYKSACRAILNYIYEKKPPLLGFTTGFDVSRQRLYKKFSELLEKHNYYCYERNDVAFRFVRVGS